MMTWSEFFAFLTFIVALFRLFLKVLQFALTFGKKKSNRHVQSNGYYS